MSVFLTSISIIDNTSSNLVTRTGSLPLGGADPTTPSALTKTYLLVLVGGDGDELGLFEHVRAKRGVRKLEDVVGSHQVEPRLVLVHGVQYRL